MTIRIRCKLSRQINPEEACTELVARANKKGDKDNYNLRIPYVNQRSEKGLKNIKTGKVVSHGDVKRILENGGKRQFSSGVISGRPTVFPR
jgi:hypothetical protein